MLALLLSVLATWSAPARVAETPLNCPAGTARADRPDRPLALGDGRYAALLGRVPELADVDANGRRLGGTPLPAGGDVATRTLACDAGGRVAAAWVELTPRTALRIAVREPGGALGAPVTILDAPPSDLEDPGVEDVALAFMPDGTPLVAYSQPHAVRALVIAGGAVRPILDARADGFAAVTADVSASGRVVVAWATQDGGEERNNPERVLAAIREPGAAAFGRPQLIDRGGSVDEFRSLSAAASGIDVGVSDDGHATVLWGQVVGRRHPVRVAESAPGRRFGMWRDLAPGGSPADVVVRGDGRTVAVWTRARRLYASLHAPGRRFGRMESVGVEAEPEWTSVDWLPDGRARVVYETLPRGLHVVTRR